MALKLNERYPGRFNSPTTQYPQGSFKNRTAPGAKDGSYLEQDWANDALAFLSSLLSGANITPNGNVDTVGASQYYTALQSLIGSDKFLKIANNLSEIKDAGPAAVTQTLANLGISGNLIPVGVPLPYPLATPPTGFLKCNGLSFSTAIYPKLALAYPSGVLPDLRGEFLRGWDDGRGVDAGRALLSLKLDTLQGHKHTIIDSVNPNYTGANSRGGSSTFGGIQYVDNAGPSSVFQASTMITNGINGTPRVDSETSPRNIAFNYIVRAI